MATIADKLEDFGFSSLSYQDNKNGSRISAYCERPLQSGLYAGWKTFSTAPIVREVEWSEILKKNQKIKISNKFQILKPLILNNSLFKTFKFDFFARKSHKQFDHSNILEFQNILVSMQDGNMRPTTTGDVYSFDFDLFYRIIEIKEDYGYMVMCRDSDFKFIKPNIFDHEKMILMSTSLLTFVDLVDLK